MRLRLTLLAFAALLLMAFLPRTSNNESDLQNDHVKSAFLFLNRKDWGNALEHAKAADNTALLKLITWQYLLDGDSGASFDDITRFIADNPDWPDQKKLRLRAELSLHTSHVAGPDLIRWFGDQEPVSGVGKIALAQALLEAHNSTSAKITGLIRDAWHNGDFDEAQESDILASYNDILRSEDKIARIDRLLWEEKVTTANRILSTVPKNYQRLFKARMCLIEDKKFATLMLSQVDPALKKDPGLLFDRMRYRSRRGDDSGVREILLSAPATVPYPEKWWHIRQQQVLGAIGIGNYKLAQKLIANHAQVDGTELAEATWTQAWLMLEFLKLPKQAYPLFYQLYDQVHTPTSRARAAYWAGRAAEKSGDSEAAASWFGNASAYPATFYGQLAAFKQFGAAPLRIPAPPDISNDAMRRFENSDLGQAIALCAGAHEIDLATHMISAIVENADADQAAMAVTFGGRLHASLGVHGAKKAQQHNIILIETGYPAPPTPSDLAIERPLVLAITRQESEFNERAQSPSGALGMMQLLPTTAKETARKGGFGYSRDRLFEPEYNMLLGSRYMSRLLGGYSGSYILAVAAYNGGPGNVHDWIRQFGTPGTNPDDAVNWIEKIPFQETRNYVQHVLANLQIYRHIEADGDPAPLKLGEDLVR